MVPATAERTRATSSGGRPSNALTRTIGGWVAVGLLERRVVVALAVGAGRQRLPGDPRSGRLLAELAADRDDERPRDGVEVDADPLAERGHLHDRHPATVDDDGGTVGG